MHILTEGQKQETLGDLIKVLSDGGLCLDGLTNILASEIAEIELKVKNAAIDNDPNPWSTNFANGSPNTILQWPIKLSTYIATL